MTIRLSQPRSRSRWGALTIFVVALMAIAVGVAYSHSGINSIPGRFTVVKDTAGANDVPAQSDLTQMGRDDDSNANVYDVFWSWDEIDQWTGSGQTGDACALFDSNSDGKINKAVCARITNPNADASQIGIVPQDASHPVFLFDCNDSRTDRCSHPSNPLAYGPTDITAGVLQPNASTALAAGNLITDTDPFPAGSDNPHDATIEVRIATSLLPTGSVLQNVCSYPSAGNGGNNNPFDCITKPGNGFLRIVKVGGSGQTFDFTVSPAPDSGNPTSVAGDSTSATLGVPFTASGSVAEAAKTGWTVTAATCALESGAATGSGFTTANRTVSNVRINPGEVTTCTFTNAPVQPTLTITKTVVNNSGGTKHATDFSFAIDGGSATAFVQDGSDPLKGKNTVTVAAGTHTLSEPAVAGYSPSSWGGDCASNGSITLVNGDNKTCSITNNDDQGSLQLVKKVTNDNGGTKGVNDFGLTTSAGTLVWDTASLVGSTTTYTANALPVNAGSYTFSESNVAGYTEGTWSCTGATASGTAYNAGSVTVPNGGTIVCSITNNDDQGSLQLVKHVVNDNGGSKTVTDFNLATSAGSLSFDTGVDEGGSSKKYTATAIAVSAGSYTFSESNVAGYTEGTWSCTGATASGTAYNAGSVTVPNGGTVVCSITNNDDQGSLQLVKRVQNDNGGSATVAAFTLATNAGALTFDSGVADGSNITKYTSNTINVNAGEYTIAEADIAAYTEGSWSCPLGTNVTSTFSAGKVTVPNGVAVVCTITNDDDKGSPGGSTAQSYVLFDSLTMSGLRTGAATPGSLTFRLYTTNTSGVCSGEVLGSGVQVANITANVKYTMATGISVTSDGTYYWTVQYSGDEYNNGFTTSCGSESTTITKAE